MWLERPSTAWYSVIHRVGSAVLKLSESTSLTASARRELIRFTAVNEYIALQFAFERLPGMYRTHNECFDHTPHAAPRHERALRSSRSSLSHDACAPEMSSPSEVEAPSPSGSTGSAAGGGGGGGDGAQS